MHFSNLSHFDKDCKKLGKKYISLPNDLQLFRKLLEGQPLGTDKHFAVLIQSEGLQICKARLFCRTLKGNSLRIVYAYHQLSAHIIFIELFYKGDKEREDSTRIVEYIKSQNLN